MSASPGSIAGTARDADVVAQSDWVFAGTTDVVPSSGHAVFVDRRETPFPRLRTSPDILLNSGRTIPPYGV